MRKLISTMPGAFLIIVTWVVFWLLAVTLDLTHVFAGKGIAVVGKEYYRFFTAPLTHTHFIHLSFNVISIFWLGYLYEERIGTLNFLTVGVVCAVLSQIVFLSIYRYAEGSIGGSLYNYALLGFVLTLQFLIPGFPKIVHGTWSGNWLIYAGILGNFPILSFMDITTLIVHVIAFAVGLIAAVLFRFLGFVH